MTRNLLDAVDKLSTVAPPNTEDVRFVVGSIAADREVGKVSDFVCGEGDGGKSHTLDSLPYRN